MFHTPRYLFLRCLGRRSILSLLSTLDTTGSFLRLLALFLGLLSCSLLGLFFLCLAGLFTSKLLSPFLLLFGLNLAEQVTGGTNLVADG